MGTSVPFLGMVMAVFAQASDMVISKAAMSRGTSKYIILVYSYALSTLILLPIYFFYQRSERPRLSFSILSSFFLLALIGCSGQTLNYAGVQYSSPTLGTAMLNLIPAFTFILALIFRMEKLDLRSSSSLAKSIGTVVSISGAFIVTFYKGSPIIIIPSSGGSNTQILLSQEGNWILGGFLSATHALMTSLWYILETSILKKYPSVLIIVFFYCFFATIQSAVVSLIAEDLSAWRLRPDLGWVAVVYSAVVGTVFRLGLTTLCVRMSGPVFVSMFKPLGVVAAALMGIIFLGDALYLGSVVGVIVIAAGFYAVMWGKAKEGQVGKGRGVGFLESSSQKEPLLQNKIQVNKHPVASLKPNCIVVSIRLQDTQHFADDDPILADDEVAHEFRFFKVYKDGRIDMFRPTWETIPPVDDPVTGVQSKDVTISTETPVSARIFLPKVLIPNQKLPLLFYSHGGGFSMMSAFSPAYHNHCSALAAEANVLVVSVEYGLFPNRPIPACYEDSWAALQWVASHVNRNGPEQWLNDHADFGKVFIGGDSAGGNISHSLAFRVGSIGLPVGVKVIGVILVHPYFGGTEDDQMWLYMCPNNSGLDDPRMNPPVEDIARLGCEKMLIFVAEKDHLNTVGKNYCEKLKKSGWKGSFELVENEKEEHCFHLHNPNHDKALELKRKFVSFLKQE